MEVKPGYKQTEVGVIPEEWRVSRVGREFDVQLGKMLDAQKNIGVLKPYIGNRAVQWDRIDISELSMVPMSRADIERFRLRKGDLLVCEGGEVGRAAIWEAPIDECYYQKALHRLRPINGFNVRVMVALLHRWCDRGLLANYVTQTSIAHLPREKFIQVPMPIPSGPEQRAIADTLSDMDALLGELESLIAKKRDLKQAAMQQLLTGKTRFTGLHGEWKVKTLEQSADCLDGVRVPLNEAQRAAMKGDYPYCGANGVLDYVNGYVIDDDIILMAEDGGYFDEYGTRPIAYRMKGKCWVNNHAHILKAKLGFDQGFLFYSLVHKNILPFLASGTRAKLNKSELNKIEVKFPAEEAEQTAIAEVLTDMDAELAALEQRREKTLALKQAMMQELLTGKTRLV